MTYWRLWWRRTALCALLLGLVVVAALLWFGLAQTLPTTLAIEDWQVGGMDFSEFERQLKAKEQLILNKRVLLTATTSSGQLQAERTLSQLGVRVHSKPLLESLEPLRSGSVFSRAAYRWQLRHAVLTLTPKLDGPALTQTLKGAFPTLYEKKPQDAQRIVEANDTIRYVTEVPADRIEETLLAERLRQSIPPWGTIEWIAAADRAVWAKEAARIAIQVPLLLEKPKVSVAMLKAQGINRKLTEYTTAYPETSTATASGNGRKHNVCSTAAVIQDVVLAPGQLFDYAAYIEQTKQRFGFKEAPVIVDGKLVNGLGGGVCQVSSTLYNAVLQAGLEIVERRNHTLPVSYVPLGRDATFASGHINFRFRNNSQHHLLIRTYTDDAKLTVKLFGDAPTDLTYEIKTSTLKTIAPSVKYVLNPTLPAGKQEVLVRGKRGYVVETYRIKKKNGVIVSKEKISRDTYAAQPAIIASSQSKGGSPDGRSLPPKAIMEEESPL